MVLLSFTEKERPTLIRDLTYGAVFSKGELTVEAGTGRIRRALLTAKIGPIRLELTTVYASDERLGIWVPTRFRERYEHGTPTGSPDSTSEYEDVLCEATYSNYRRFETRARIK